VLGRFASGFRDACRFHLPKNCCSDARDQFVQQVEQFGPGSLIALGPQVVAVRRVNKSN
jgi:hypothetical protein